MRLLADGPLSKAALASALGHRAVSGGLNRAVRRLVVDGTLALTVPDSPRSRLQEYRLTVAGRARLARQQPPSATP